MVREWPHLWTRNGIDPITIIMARSYLVRHGIQSYIPPNCNEENDVFSLSDMIGSNLLHPLINKLWSLFKHSDLLLSVRYSTILLIKVLTRMWLTMATVSIVAKRDSSGDFLSWFGRSICFVGLGYWILYLLLSRPVYERPITALTMFISCQMRKHLK